MAVAVTQAQRADAERIAESQQTVACNQHHHGVRTLDATNDTPHRLEHIGGHEGQPACGVLQLMGQHIEQHLGVTVGVDVAVVAVEQFRLQRRCVGEVAVVRHDQPERRVHVKRLRLFFAVRIARCGVANLAHTHIAGQCAHVAGTEHITHHAFGLVHVELAPILRGYACRVLPPML